MNAEEFTALLLLSTAVSFTPGPNTTLSTALAANFGWRHALRFVLAVPVGWGLLLLLCAAGLGPLVLAVPLLQRAIQWSGVAYLMWLAWQLLRVRQPGAVDRQRLHVSFVEGVGLQFLNIKAWLLALAVVGGWVVGQPQPWQRFAVVLPTMLAFALASNLSYALVGALLRHWLAGPDGSGRRLCWFNRLMALLLLLTAGWILSGT